MAKFCKYCGKQIDGGVCDCPQALAEVHGKVAGIDPRNVRRPEEPPYQPPHPQYQPGQAKIIGNDVKNLFIHMFTDPVSAFKQAAASPNKLPQYLIAAAYVLLWLIHVSFIVKNDWVPDDLMRKIGLTIALVALITRGVYAAGVYGFAKKWNPNLTLESALGVFSMTFAYDMVLLVLQDVVGKTGIYEISIALVVFWLAMDVTVAYLLTLILTNYNNSAAFRITLILQLVILIMLVFALRGIATKTIESVVGNLQNSLVNSLFSELF